MQPSQPRPNVPKLQTHPPALITLAIGLVLTAGLAGCGKKASRNPDAVAVSGTVTLDGQPLGGASVNFWSDKDQFAGTTGPEGRYALVPGADPGAYTVTIRKASGSGPGGVGVEPGFEPPQDVQPITQQIPAQYADRTRSQLTFTVDAAGTDAADFNLTTE